ncbi:hypothetical protein BC826DRAFT_954755 [Russula brevipes]|nr:hypothetical protein BC826DRAFT_954755 [Russula brevipes]
MPDKLRPDEQLKEQGYYVLEYPGPAGRPIRNAEPAFARSRQANLQAGEAPWSPFVSKDEWEFASWILQNLGHHQIDDLLKLDFIKKRTGASFYNSYTFFKKVDGLSCGPRWNCEIVRLPNGTDGTEHEAELWMRDIGECIVELLGNPDLQDDISYKPMRVFQDPEKTERVYGEAWTADWWWDTQAKLPEGATVVPVILSTDKTRLTNLSGDQQAWPVYLSLGNISKSLRRRPSSHTTVLVGYLPVVKMHQISEKDRSVEIYRLFHHSMRCVLRPMQDAGSQGTDVVCGDGVVRRVYPILVSYIADFPEQCLVACCKESRCPRCMVPADEREYPGPYTLRRQDTTLNALQGHRMRDALAMEVFNADGIRRVYQPFWAELPHCDIFSCFTPDILHQLHKGIFHSHLVEWCTQLIGEDDLDARFKSIPGHPGLRHFKGGISGISQWTGKEHKAMEKVFLGIISGAVDQRVVLVARSILDFTYYAQLQSHTNRTIAALEESLSLFHANKSVLVDLGIREHFNVPKIHMISHYADSIRSHGSLDAYNSEASERLHIDYAKDGYRASNQRDYIAQMTKWLQRREAIRRRTGFIAWCERNPLAEDDQESGDEPETRMDHDDGESKSHSYMAKARRYTIAKKSPYPAMPPGQIEQIYNVSGFLTALTVFLRGCAARSSSVVPTVHDHFECFNQISISFPSDPRVVSESSKPLVKSIVRAAPLRPSNNPRAPATRPALSDTAFVLEVPATPADPNPPIRIARLRVIFRLPGHLGYTHPLAFVEWYTHLGPIDTVTQMYHISRATRNRRPHAAVICVTQILRNCHLIPQFPRRVNREWTSENSLDLGTRFFVNTYIDFNAFVTCKCP